MPTDRRRYHYLAARSACFFPCYEREHDACRKAREAEAARLGLNTWNLTATTHNVPPWPNTTTDLEAVDCLECWECILEMAKFKLANDGVAP